MEITTLEWTRDLNISSSFPVLILCRFAMLMLQLFNIVLQSSLFDYSSVYMAVLSYYYVGTVHS